MELNNLTYESVVEGRVKAVNKSTREISATELEALIDGLFPDQADPERERLQGFIDANGSASFFHAESTEQIQVIYSRARETGFWFIPGVGIGVLGPRDLKIMKEVVDAIAPTKL